MIYILMIALVFFLWCSFILNKKDLVAPSFVFSASFCFSCAWAVAYARKWDLDLHLNTFMIILGGVLEFIIISFFTQNYFAMTKGKKNVSEKLELIKIEIETWKKILFLLFGILTILYTLYSIAKIMNGSLSNIGESINAYRNVSAFTSESVSLPRLVTYLRYAVLASGYWFAYVFINNYLITKKFDILSILIVVISAISNMTTGGRGGAIYIIVACVAIFVILMNKRNGFIKSIRFKTLIRFIIVAIIILCVFQSTGSLLGRTSSSATAISNMTFFDYLSVYCGAEIKNLDLFLQENHSTSNIWGSQTFIYVIRWLGPKLGIKNTYYQLTLPFRKVNGFNLGNVYTTFYPYIYDFGYTGSIILVGLMAFLTQWVYEKCKRVKIKNRPAMSILIYSFMFSLIVLSFFSNKFYEQIFNKQFVMALIFWYIYDVFFCKIRVRRR